MRTHRGRPGVEREDGAVLVEAAIALPLLFLLLFGILEFGLIFKDSLTVTSATRAGARTASALSRQPIYQDSALKAMEGLLRSSVQDEGIEYVSIYKANDQTGQPVDGTGPEDCITCYRYKWDTATQTWVGQDGVSWLSTQQRACGGQGNTDYLGVYIRYRHDKVTKFFGDAQTLTDSTVMRLEPIATNDVCEP